MPLRTCILGTLTTFVPKLTVLYDVASSANPLNFVWLVIVVMVPVQWTPRFAPTTVAP